MSNPIIDAAIAQAAASDNVIDSAVIVLNSFPALVQAAVDAAIAGGATAAELQPVSDAIATMKVKTDALAVAVAASTPAPPPTPVQAKKAAASKAA